MSRKKNLRQNAIVDQLSINPAMRVSALSEVLGVTTETIRRDLEALSEQKLISRTYGGAVLRQPSEPVVSERHKSYIEERIAIAKEALPLLKEAKVLMIGSGATTTQVAKRIAFEMNHITVVTHSFGVATALSFNPTIQVIMAPGVYHAGEGAVHGAQTIRFLSELNADWVILGASGVAPAGPSDALIDAADVYRTMIQQSSRHMLVADHSKFDRLSTALYGQWEDVDYLICDAMPKGLLGKALKASHVNLKVTN